jgi:hypothetical protein
MKYKNDGCTDGNTKKWWWGFRCGVGGALAGGGGQLELDKEENRPMREKKVLRLVEVSVNIVNRQFS